MKRILLFCAVLLALASCAEAAMTYGGTYYRQHLQMALSGNTAADPIYLFMNEMETDMDLITLDNGLTIDNATNNVLEINENSDELKFTFGSNTITVSSGATADADVTKMDFDTMIVAANEVLFNPVTDANTTEGTVYYDSDDDNLYVRTTAGWVDLTAGASGVTDLDTAYNGGNTIDVDGSAVTLTVSDGDNNPVAVFAQNDSTNDPTAVQITSAADAANAISLDIDAQATGRDIEGTGATWYVTGAGALTAATVATTSSVTAASGLTMTAGNFSAGDGTGTAAFSTSSWDITTTGALSGITTLGMSGDLTNSGGDVIVSNGKGLMGSTTNAETLDVSAYDVDNTTYRAVITLTNGNTIAAAIGTGNETVAVDSTTWDVSTAGVVSGVTGLSNSGSLTQTGQIDADFSVNTEELDITTAVTDYGADSAVATIYTSGAGATNNTYLLRLRNNANADAQDHFLVIEDNNGDDKLAVDSGGIVTSTLDATGYVKIDGNTTANTGVAGVLDLDVQSATNNHIGMSLTYQLEDNATQAYGIKIDIDDDATGGETIDAINIGNSAGTSSTTRGLVFVNTLDDDIVSALGAASQYLVLDAASAVQTGTDGVFDLSYQTATNGAEFINIDSGIGDLADSEIVSIIYVDMDDDDTTAGAADSLYYGLHINGSDITGNSTVTGVYVQSADAALQADKGYVRIGTGSTPDVTPGDDDLYVEGVAEVDSYVRTPYIVADSNIVVPSEIHVDTVELLNSEIKGMRAAPVELIATPGANKFIEVISAVLILDYGSEVLTESADNMVIQYNTSGTDITGAIEATSFIDAAADTIAIVYPAAIANTAAANAVGRAVELFNTGDGEYAGNASNDTRMTVKISYRIHSDGL